MKDKQIEPFFNTPAWKKIRQDRFEATRKKLVEQTIKFWDAVITKYKGKKDGR